ncbi:MULTISPECIES: head-tail connector protein [Pseudomonas]|uniref:Prophage PssSM-03, Orf25 n=3 Tax=Pseudomonas TaxID=286 RepID=A0A0N8R0T0_9PSED|nr:MULTISPECIES: head-tail connector protein [Pseudomonas]KPW82046.1 Prophage PssSM-03, Orf25 [Pseudomonas congelans]RMR53314.1 Prophage PssSM-03, Orf25 [Pseudomonas syringae pv. actinidiae]SDO89559.1 uncharacterized phage protein (possible DNA packaging) [Pseudomonas congelans]
MIDLALVKIQLKVDGEEEDRLIAGYVEAAKSHVAMHCDRELVEGDPAGPEQMGFTPDVEQAVLLLVGHWYVNREAVVIGGAPAEVQLAFERLLWYRKRF